MHHYSGITKNELTSHKHKTCTYYHKGQKKIAKYCIVIHHIDGLTGLGDGLGRIILEYSTASMFGKPVMDTHNGYIPDQRAQTIIAAFSNHNNILPYIEDIDRETGAISTTECHEGTVFRRNINLQRLGRKHVFWATCKIIQDDLFTSLFARREMISSTDINQSLFAYLPSEIVTIIIKQLVQIGLFNTLGIDVQRTQHHDFCCPISK